MNQLRFIFRFGKVFGAIHFILPIMAIWLFYRQTIISLACVGLLGFMLGSDLMSWGYYKHGGDYFTVQPERFGEDPK